jgi:hypothetical protein
MWPAFDEEAKQKNLHYEVLLPSQFLYMSLEALASTAPKIQTFSRQLPEPLYLRESTAEEKLKA